MTKLEYELDIWRVDNDRLRIIISVKSFFDWKISKYSKQNHTCLSVCVIDLYIICYFKIVQFSCYLKNMYSWYKIRDQYVVDFWVGYSKLDKFKDKKMYLQSVYLFIYIMYLHYVYCISFSVTLTVTHYFRIPTQLMKWNVLGVVK